MNFTARTTDDFLAHWNDTRNFLLGPELIEFDLALPCAEEIIDILRRDGDSRVQFLRVEDEAQREDLVEKFKTRPPKRSSINPSVSPTFFSRTSTIPALSFTSSRRK